MVGLDTGGGFAGGFRQCPILAVRLLGLRFDPVTMNDTWGKVKSCRAGNCVCE